MNCDQCEMDANQDKRYSAYYEGSKMMHSEDTGDSEDPYVTMNAAASNSGSGLDWQQWPDVEYPDILNYLVVTAYVAQMKNKHIGFCVRMSGLVIHPSCSHMGASPDGRIRCECCDPGVLEVKCPFSCKDKTFIEVTAANFFEMESLL